MDSEFVYLASTSPRRRELLNQIGVAHRVLPVTIPECQRANEAPETFVVRTALEKARAGWATLASAHQAPVLAADTAVVLGERVLGKPRDRDDGLAMLRELSGRTHRVLTAVALIDGDEHSRLSVSRVRWRELSEQECVAYWLSGEPCDKAGAYGIQGLGAIFVEHLDGSYSGVMGLPIFETAELLRLAGVEILSVAKE
jgi:septum formation protein